MKIARFFAVIFAVLGLILMLGTTVLCFASLEAPVQVTQTVEAERCAKEMMDAIAASDFAAASEKMYGHPDLGTQQALTEEAAAVWEIFCKGISYTFTSDCYVSGSTLAMDVTVSVPDIASITDSVDDHARTIMEARIAAATEMAQLYDEENNFRQELVDEVMAGAVELAFAEEPQVLTYECTLGLVWQGEQWWVIPDAALLSALRGGLA